MGEDLEQLLMQEMGFWAAPHPPVREIPRPHRYLSTACFHGLHAQCRRWCKFCSVSCLCEDPDCPCYKFRNSA